MGTEAAMNGAAPSQAAASVDLTSLPTRAYLDRTVVPLVLQGMALLAKERCVWQWRRCVAVYRTLIKVTCCVVFAVLNTQFNSLPNS